MTASVLLIGLDAMEGRLVKQWAATGMLPNIAALMERAQWAEVGNPVGFCASVSVWPSFYTASTPAQHGRYAYRQYVPDTYGTRETSPEELLCPPFWQLFSERGKRLAILDMPSGPLFPGLDGIQLAYWGPHDIEGEFATWPPELAASIVSRYGTDEVGQCDNCGHGPGDMAQFRDRLLRRIAGRRRFSLDLLDDGHWDLFCTVFSEAHCAGHQAWHLHDPGQAGEDGDSDDILARVYCAIDEAIGELLAKVGPGARVMLYASQGMGPAFSGEHLINAILSRREPAGTPSAGGRLYQGLYRLRSHIPPVLHQGFGRLKNRLRNRLLSGDWAGRDCFPLPPSINAVSCLRLNIAGRDPMGRLQPGAAVEAYCRDLCRDLEELVNPASGRAAVQKITRLDNSEGPSACFPDLLVHWDNAEPVAALESQRLGRIEGTPASRRSGDHTPDGFALVTHPVPGRLERKPDCVDLVPTLAAWLGLEGVPFHGRPVPEWL